MYCRLPCGFPGEWTLTITLQSKMSHDWPKSLRMPLVNILFRHSREYPPHITPLQKQGWFLLGFAQFSSEKCAKQLVLSTPSPPRTLMPQHDARDAPSHPATPSWDVKNIHLMILNIKGQTDITNRTASAWFPGCADQNQQVLIVLTKQGIHYIDVHQQWNSVSGSYDLLTLLSCLLTCLKSAPCNIHPCCLWMISLHLATGQNQHPLRMPSPCRRTWFSSPSTVYTERLWIARGWWSQYQKPYVCQKMDFQAVRIWGNQSLYTYT